MQTQGRPPAPGANQRATGSVSSGIIADCNQSATADPQDFPRDPSAYRFARYQMVGGADTWHCAPIEGINRLKPRFITIQRWPRSVVGHEDEYRDWPHLADAYFEGDCDTDEELAELGRGFIRFYNHLTEVLGIPDEAIRLYYSGGRSFHLTIDWHALGVEPSPYLTKAYGLWAADVARRFGLKLDLGIYSRARQFRRPGSCHESTGLFKIPLTWQDLTRPIPEIREMARQPRPDPWDGTDPPDVAPLAQEELAEFLDQARGAHAVQARSRAADASGERITEKRRNVTLTSLAGRLRRGGLSGAAIEAALLVENETRCDPPLPEAEVRSIAASIGRYPAGELPKPCDDSDPCAERIAQLEQVIDIQRRTIQELRRDNAELRANAVATNAVISHPTLSPTLKVATLATAPAVLSAQPDENGFRHVILERPKFEHDGLTKSLAERSGLSPDTMGKQIAKLTDLKIFEKDRRRVGHGEDQRVSLYLKPKAETTVAGILTAVANLQVERSNHGGARTKRVAQIEIPPCPTCDEHTSVTLRGYCDVCGDCIAERQAPAPLSEPDPGESLNPQVAGLGNDPLDDDRDLTAASSRFRDEPDDPPFGSLKLQDADLGSGDSAVDLFGPLAADDELEEAEDQALDWWRDQLADPPDPEPPPPPRLCHDCGSPLSPERRTMCEPCAIAAGALPLERPGGAP